MLVPRAIAMVGVFLFLSIGRTLAADPAAIYDHVAPATALVINLDEESQGTGVVIELDRRLLATAAHVVEGTETVVLVFADHDRDGDVIVNVGYYFDQHQFESLVVKGRVVRARVVCRNPTKDLAILQAETLPSDVAAVSIATSRVADGGLVHVVGHPAERDLWSYALGQVKGYEQQSSDIEGRHFDATTLAIYSNLWNGNSGGPVVNDAGELVGIVSFRSHLVQFAVDVAELKGLIKTVGGCANFAESSQQHGTVPVSRN